MKEIKLFFDMEFTSLSPDAQVISLGIVSEEIKSNVPVDEIREFDNGTLKLKNHKASVENGFGMTEFTSKSFYAEFTDFQLERCDDWVKENVVGKLKYKSDDDKANHRMSNAIELSPIVADILQDVFNGDSLGESISKHIDSEKERKLSPNISTCDNTRVIKELLKEWLSQFSTYQLQFVTDCGTFDWYHLLQLVAEWDEVPSHLIIDTAMIPSDMTIEDFVNAWKEQGPIFVRKLPEPKYINIGGKIGLPKLPSNISPVPQDLNDLIAFREGISVKEAFELNREGMISVTEAHDKGLFSQDKHNSLYDVKVIKAIYGKLV